VLPTVLSTSQAKAEVNLQVARESQASLAASVDRKAANPMALVHRSISPKSHGSAVKELVRTN
jgi:hypothetical protein